MRYLKTSEAATLLNVSPNTLRAWERRFDFPKPLRSPGKHRLFTHGEVAALRDALQEGLSISSAVSRAREGLASDTHSLIGALVSYERERADGAIESALALRSVERSVEEVLLPTLDEIARRHTTESAAWAFAAHWAADWLRRAQRLAPPPVRPVSIVVGDASRDELDPDAPHIRALELFCVRSGVNVLSLSARGVAGIGDPIAVHRPNLVVLAGGHLEDDAVGLWGATRGGRASRRGVSTGRPASARAHYGHECLAIGCRRSAPALARARGGGAGRQYAHGVIGEPRLRRGILRRNTVIKSVNANSSCS
jgi:MerR family transcriptional regulator, light-induced transcriptional regulator